MDLAGTSAYGKKLQRRTNPVTEIGIELPQNPSNPLRSTFPVSERREEFIRIIHLRLEFYLNFA